MNTRAKRTNASAAVCLLLMTVGAGCASRPDIRGTSSEAQEWAEQQKKEDAETKGKSALPPPVQTPVAPPAPTTH
jgi:hypothetical protein